MTREEAIFAMNYYKLHFATEKGAEAFDMAIKALSSSEIPNTCGDAISRKAVLDIIRSEDKWLLDAKSHNVDTKMAFWIIKSKISELASVNPNRKAE